MKYWLAPLLAGVFATATLADDRVIVIPTEGAVTAIVETNAGVFAETARGTVRITTGDCPGGVCLKNDVIRGLPARAPEGALPDGSIAQTAKGDIRKAWYGKPTNRYAHGVLGDAIEGGSLVVELADGTTSEVVLPEAQVFEDITPRIYDFDADGKNEIVTIRASKTGGGAIVVYGLTDAGELGIVGFSAENGRPNRWLNVAGIAGNTIYFIRTPHIRGRLATLTITGGKAQAADDVLGDLSNHVIGSRELGLSAFFDGGRGSDLFIPSQSRSTLRAVGGKYADIDLPGRIDKAVVAVGDVLISATDKGQLLAIKP